MCRAQGQGTRRGDDPRLTDWTGTGTGGRGGKGEFLLPRNRGDRCNVGRGQDRGRRSGVGGEWKLGRVGKRATRKCLALGAAMDAGKWSPR